MANKLRVLHRPLNVTIDLSKILVKAICILRNFVRVRDGYSFEDTLSTPGLILVEERGPPCRVNAVTYIREKCDECFVSTEGEVPVK